MSEILIHLIYFRLRLSRGIFRCKNRHVGIFLFLLVICYIAAVESLYLDSFQASKMVRDIGALWYPDVTQTLQRLGFEVHIDRYLYSIRDKTVSPQ